MLEALQADGHLRGHIEPPAWLGDEQPLPAEEIVAMSNGLLHLPSRKLLPHSPAFFNLHALPFAYDPDAPEPQRWFRFLAELWQGDRQAISALAEIMGYILSGDTEQQKLFLLVGPKRSGKGTIGRVLTGLLGAHNVAAPTLSGLATNFGLQPLIGKPLAIVSDARLAERAQGLIAVERLLSVSGEDTITVDRKYRDPWTGRLPSRFLILTNELPRLHDSSGALASRFILLTTAKSFYGRENPKLTKQLLEEAPGIFNWSLAGLDRLTERGHFVQPTSAGGALRHLEDLGSPVGAFVREMCEVGTGYEVSKDALFQLWKDWCEEEGRRPGDKSVFGRDLRAAVSGLGEARPGKRGEKRAPVWRGVQPTVPVVRDTPGHGASEGAVAPRVTGHEHRGARSGEEALLAEAEAVRSETEERWVPPEEQR